MDIPAPLDYRLALRRAAFRNAIRAGDAVDAARAASRLLVAVQDLDIGTGMRIRDARTRLGRGLRLARQRRAHGPISPSAAHLTVVPKSTSRASSLRRVV